MLTVPNTRNIRRWTSLLAAFMVLATGVLPAAATDERTEQGESQRNAQIESVCEEACGDAQAVPRATVPTQCMMPMEVENGSGRSGARSMRPQYPLQRQTSHFSFLAPMSAVPALDDLAACLEDTWMTASEDMGLSPVGTTEVVVYPGLESFHLAMGASAEASDYWTVSVWNDTIHMVSPLNPGPARTTDEVHRDVQYVFAHSLAKVGSPFVRCAVALYPLRGAQQGATRPL